jgi:hypothetical protein
MDANLHHLSHKPVIDVLVEPHPALSDGVTLRYKAESAMRTVTQVQYEPDDGPEGVWQVVGVDARGQDVPAHAVQVEDSGAGTSWLIWGDARGLRLRLNGLEVPETHLLLALDQLAD